MKEYSLRFGQSPLNFIERKKITDQITNELMLDFPSSNAYIITGIRGSGKTVLLTKISKHFATLKNWIVIDINPENDVLPQIAAYIYNSDYFKRIFPKFSFNFSFHGFGISIEGKEPASDIKIVLKKMLSSLKKNNIKILVTIDEVSNTQKLRAFAHDFQSFVRDDYQMFLLMTGLNENVESLINNKALTFLLRTPKYFLNPLNLEEIQKNYCGNLRVSEEESKKLSQLTKGYAFAFQVVGLLYNKYRNLDKIYNELDIYLSTYVYDKIWSSIPKGEKQILHCFSNTNKLMTSEIIEKAKLSEKEFSSYRDRLLKRGVVQSNERGFLELSLPRFENYISRAI